MPTYQYACTACGHQLEAVQSFTDAPLTQCPACEGRLRKLFSAVGVVFKGSGFYRTDSRAGAKNGSRNGADKEPVTAGSTTTASESTGSGSSGSSGTTSSANGSAGTSSSSGKPAAKPAASAA